MMYHLMTRADDAPSRLPAILAEEFRVTLAETDVSAGSEWEDRNWDAVVTCEYEPLQGDLSWSLTIYAANEVRHQPSEAALASAVARSLSASVFVEWDSRFPWMRRVALPEGGHTLARVTQSGEDGPGYSVDAAESTIPDVPHVPVMRLPEVVQAYDIPTPITDSVEWVGIDKGSGDLATLVRNWERLCSRLRTGWPPEGWYSATLYREDLEFRSRLDTEMEALPPEVDKSTLQEVVEKLDFIYRNSTSDDGGLALSAALEESPEKLSRRPWYWRRRPLDLPWLEAGPNENETQPL
ncbi:hypothetical protein [Streptomyces sp. A012304]|uniref:hypothetical protein n=1 Tax=Streptomyces sp. A012304 TaxID=375446 RepID=UPI00222ED8FD|nr:hypothetical protein [Streptomyces sp. A012304]GKQ37610.1 hypothetical protein ALMP_41470 [Streptomyces sp. A012304]